jgi:arabinofuranosyltransferase
LNFRFKHVPQYSHWLALLFIAYFFVLLRNAWLTEDAFITLRTADNFISGYGLRWNISERVQTFTHPLWFCVITAAYWLTGEAFYTTIFVSVALSLLTVWLLIYRLCLSRFTVGIALSILIASKAFVEYSTSGLENPLSHLLVVFFLISYHKKNLFEMALVAGLAMCNRLDIGLLFLPPLAIFFMQLRTVSLSRLAVAFAPLALWELFSLFYYGLPFPNTAYAKLNTGIASSDLLLQGVYYLGNSLRLDPITLPALLLVVFFSLSNNFKRTLPLALGIALYMCYIVYIGGDFMSGRFLSLPFIASIATGCLYGPALSHRSTWAIISVVGIVSIVWAQRSSIPEDAHNISDEYVKFSPYTGLLSSLTADPHPNHWWAERARLLRAGLEQSVREKDNYLISRSINDSTFVTTWLSVGMSGFYAGPTFHIIDALSITDPLLARLPAMMEKNWRPGHFKRFVPTGYIESHIQEANLIADSRLAEYYEKLSIVIRGDLFTTKRLLEIWRLNTGYYSHLIDYAYYRNPPALDRQLSELRIQPSNSIYYIDLGRHLFAMGHSEKAISALDKAQSILPNSFANYYQIGYIYYSQGLYDRAVTTQLHALEIIVAYITFLQQRNTDEQTLREHTDAQALINNALGASQEALNKLSEAEVSYLRAMSLDKTNTLFEQNIRSLYLRMEAPD